MVVALVMKLCSSGMEARNASFSKAIVCEKCGPGCNVKASTGNMTVFNGLNRGY